MVRASGRKGHMTPTEREAYIARTAELDLKDYTALQISRELDISVATVYQYLKIIRERYVEDQVDNRSVLVVRKLKEYQQLRWEAWKAYEKSKADAERESEEWGLRSLGKEDEQEGKDVPRNGKKGSKQKTTKPPGKNLRELIKVKATKMRQGRLPGVEYLRLIADTYKAEREMLGLDEAIKLDVKAQVLDWKVFTLDLNRTDVVEQKMQEALNQLPPIELLEDDAMRNGGWQK